MYLAEINDRNIAGRDIFLIIFVSDCETNWKKR